MDLMLPVPTAGLIASLTAHAAVETARDGTEVFGSLLLTHPPQIGAEERIERDMRGVAAAVGAVAPSEVIPEVGVRVAVGQAGEVRIRFDGTDYVGRLHLPSHYGPALLALGRVLLAVGLDPMPRTVTLAERESYIFRTVGAGRTLFASASVAALAPLSAGDLRPAQPACPAESGFDSRQPDDGGRPILHMPGNPA